jgi:hypothetical protein
MKKLFISIWNLIFPAKDSMSGVILKSNSGITWFLGSRLNWHTPQNPSSKIALQTMGFRVLGQYDTVRFAVEPPRKWTMERLNEQQGYLKDETGKRRVRYFENLGDDDYRAFICILKEDETE